MLQGLVMRGTTPQHEFDLPYPGEIIEDVRVAYGQKHQVIFIKTLEDCQIDGNKLSVSLTQEETLMFAPDKLLCIEIKIKLTNGEVVRTTDPVVLRVVDTMDEEVMG